MSAIKVAKKLSDIFVQRWDIYAKQLGNGKGYMCVREPLKLNKIVSHLKGRITLATYVLAPENTVRYAVLDADGENGLRDLFYISWALGEEGIKSYIELSRRGGHLWFFFSQDINGGVARGFGEGIMNHFEMDEIEIFPKQDRLLNGGPGSSIRLPFGIHRKSGKRYDFITLSRQKLAPTIEEQISILHDAEKVPLKAIWKYFERKPEKSSKNISSQDYQSDLFKVDLLGFLENYVDFETYYTCGALGYCPFHKDVNNPSFSVSNKKGNWLWQCFADSGCGGGNIITFWAKYRKIKYSEAERQLKFMLGVK